MKKVIAKIFILAVSGAVLIGIPWWTKDMTDYTWSWLPALIVFLYLDDEV